MKTFKIGENGLNHLSGAYECFIKDAKIIEQHSKNYPTYQSGINSKKQIKKLKNAAKKVKNLTSQLKKELVF